MTIAIKILDTGNVLSDMGRRVQSLPVGQKTWQIVLCYLLLGREPVLVDTGFRNAEILKTLGSHAHQTKEQALEYQLELHGIKPADIRYVIHTHLHIDHAGRTDLFPMSTPAVVTRRELEYSVSGLSGPSYPPADIKHLIDRLHTKGALQLLDLELSGREEIIPGIWCESAGAHTEGSMFVYVETSAGVACLCGDVIYNIHHQLIYPRVVLDSDVAISGNYVVTRRSEKAAMKRLVNSGARFICPSHDWPAVMEGRRVVGRAFESIPGPISKIEPGGKDPLVATDERLKALNA